MLMVGRKGEKALTINYQLKQEPVEKKNGYELTQLLEAFHFGT